MFSKISALMTDEQLETYAGLGAGDVLRTVLYIISTSNTSIAYSSDRTFNLTLASNYITTMVEITNSDVAGDIFSKSEAQGSSLGSRNYWRKKPTYLR